MMKYVAVVLLLILLFSVALTADAAVCRNFDSHQICILSIKRSAKNYWEYTASVSVDNIKTPTQVYNCRDRLKILPDKTVVPFGQKDPGELICSFFKR
jgi:hypothetical protein